MKEMDDESNDVDENDDDLLKMILEQLLFVTLNFFLWLLRVNVCAVGYVGVYYNGVIVVM